MIRDCRAISEYIAVELRRRADVAVVGLSGGADSTLVAVLCGEALGRENVWGVSMPYDEFDRGTFNSKSAALAAVLGIQHLLRPVHEIADAVNRRIGLDDPACELTAVNAGNSRSRARMCVLYGIAHTLSTQFPGKRVRVIGTGNLSEDFIGYDTKGGDALADIFPIGHLFKSEVYQLLDYFRDRRLIDESMIDRVPSAGLRHGQTDEGDLGHTYAEMEKGIRFCLANRDRMDHANPDGVTAFVWNRHVANRHKHEAPPVLPLRQFCD